MLKTTSSKTDQVRGSVIYLRCGLNGFDVWDGRELAILTLIDKDGNAAENNDIAYYVPINLLIPGGVLVSELKAIQEAKNVQEHGKQGMAGGKT